MTIATYIAKTATLDGVALEAHAGFIYPPDGGQQRVAIYSWMTVADFLAEKDAASKLIFRFDPPLNAETLLVDLVDRQDSPLYGGTVTTSRFTTMTLEQEKARAWERIKREREQREYGGFEWDGSRFDSDAESQRRIQGAVQLALLATSEGQPFSIDWTLEDNTVRTLSAADMIAVGAALGQYVSALYNVSRTLRAAVQAAQTLEELNAIGWPQ